MPCRCLSCLYNMPVHVKVSLEPATVKELAGHPNIIGLKDSSSNMVYFQTLLYELSDRPDFALFMGPEQLTAESVMLEQPAGSTAVRMFFRNSMSRFTRQPRPMTWNG